MKKYSFIIIPICILMTYLLSHTLFRFNNTTAKIASAQKKEFAHYESLLKSVVLKDTSGHKFSQKELSSGVVILNFWASWCTPCLEEFPSLVELVKSHSKVLKVIGINTDEENQLVNIRKKVKEFKLNFPIVADVNSQLLEKFLISAIPISIVFKNGKVIDVSQGRKDFSAVEFLELLED